MCLQEKHTRARKLVGVCILFASIPSLSHFALCHRRLTCTEHIKGTSGFQLVLAIGEPSRKIAGRKTLSSGCSFYWLPSQEVTLGWRKPPLMHSASLQATCTAKLYLPLGFSNPGDRCQVVCELGKEKMYTPFSYSTLHALLVKIHISV